MPIRPVKKFPGNIGDGISRDATVKREKNASSIAAPLKKFALVLIYGLCTCNRIGCRNV